MAKVPPIPSSEITSEHDYANRPRPGMPPPEEPDDDDRASVDRGRRLFVRNVALATVGAGVFGAGLFAWSKRRGGAPAPSLSSLAPLSASPSARELSAVALGDDDALTSLERVTTHNNFYEFGLDKGDPARNAGTLKPRPWTVRVGGEVAEPKTWDLDELLKEFPLEDRTYRMRCVEAWSMVIPWLGFPLGKLLARSNPTSRAKYVAFKTLHDPKQMPGQTEDVLPWPYVEGLRMDEAMHPLAIIAAGLYGRELPHQNGAPLRLVVPWKYGFKGIKSIVAIDLVESLPPTTWNKAAPREYGFFANVNPNVDHPRWSQATERRLGASPERRRTLMFNGYSEQVASLYADMDLERFF